MTPKKGEAMPDDAKAGDRDNVSIRRSTRSYSYDPGDVHRLFFRIIQSLSSPDLPDDLVAKILAEVCQHFRFGCGFVYEADHTRTFHLKEWHASYESRYLPESFQLEMEMDAKDIAELRATSYFYHHEDNDRPASRHSRMFDASTCMLAPVLDEDLSLVGLVGIMDRRRNILLGDASVQAARMVLNLLANNIKLRVYRRNLEYTRQSLIDILDNTGVDIYVNDFHTHEILYANKSMAEPYGGLDSLMGKKCWQALYTDKTGQCDYCPEKRLIDEEGNPTRMFSWDYRRPFDGSWFRVLSSAFRWYDGRLAHVVSSVDITESKNNEAIISRMANYDALTNLPNRRKLLQDCEEAMLTAGRSGGGGSLLFFDLDNFKELNDSVGHQAGDDLLAAVGQQLLNNPLTHNHCYRYGGDEFVLLYRNVSRRHVNMVVRFLLDRFDRPWVLKNASPVCRASIGIAAFPGDAQSADELLHRADMMMYKAKQNGRGMACFIDGEIIKSGS